MSADTLLKILALGSKEIDQGKFRAAEEVLSILDQRLAEDDAMPNDTIAWESLKAESHARWQR